MRLTLAGGANPSGLQWALNYPEEDLTFTDAAVGPAAMGAAKTIQCQPGAGRTTCLVVGFNQNTILDGELATLSFTIAPMTTASAANVTLSGLVATSAQGVGLPITGSGNSVIIDQGGGDPAHQITGVLDAATFQPLISPGGIVSVFGSFAETTAVATTLPLPQDMNGFSVTFDGIPGALYGVFADPGGLGFDQANLQVPWDLVLSGDPIEVRVHWQDNSSEIWSEPFEVAGALASPGIFEVPLHPGSAIVTNFSLSPEDGVITGSSAQAPATIPENFLAQEAAVGGVIIVWCTGLGPVDPPVETGNIPSPDTPVTLTTKNVKLFIGGEEAVVLAAALQATNAGLYQINAIVPDIAPTNDAEIIIEIECDDEKTIRSKAGATIAVRAAPAFSNPRMILK